MRPIAAAAVVLIAVVLGSHAPAWGQANNFRVALIAPRGGGGDGLTPFGWLLADQLFAIEVVTHGRLGGPRWPPRRIRHAGGCNISVPTVGETDFVPNEVLLEFRAGASPQQIGQMTTRLQLTPLETQSFSLTGRTLRRFRIDGGRSIRATLLAMRQIGIVDVA
jgi:hypothetical protein